MAKIVDNNEQKFFLECSVCMDTYNHLESSRTPKLLLCAHTFCTTCLDGLLMNGSIICPMCRKSTTVPNGVEGLLKNFALIEVLSSGILDQVKQNVCPHCKNNPINIYCPECNAEMCEECSKSVHAFAFLQSHKPAVGTRDELPQTHKCAEHDESLKLFCEDDQVPICMVCNLFGAHKGHNAIFLNDKLKEHQTHLKKQLVDLEERSNSLRLFSEQLIANEKTLSGNQYAAEQKIKKQFSKLVQILAKREEYLLKQVQQDADWKRSTLLKQRQEAAVEISKFAAVSQETRLIMSGDKTSLMSSVGVQSSKIKKLIDSQTQRVNSDTDLNVSIQFDDNVLKSGAVYGIFKPSRHDQIHASPPELLACEVKDPYVAVESKPSTKRDKSDQYSSLLRKSDLDNKWNKKPAMPVYVYGYGLQAHELPPLEKSYLPPLEQFKSQPNRSHANPKKATCKYPSCSKRVGSLEFCGKTHANLYKDKHFETSPSDFYDDGKVSGDIHGTKVGTCQPRWEYRDGDKWKPYNIHLQESLEHVFQNGKKTGHVALVKFKENGVSYSVDIGRRKQMNDMSTFERGVRRSLIDFNDLVELKLISTTSQVGKRINDKFCNSWTKKSIAEPSAITILEIRNNRLKQRFERYRKRVSSECKPGQPVVIQHLFHGSTTICNFAKSVAKHTLCDNSKCATCNISKVGFKLDWGRFGRGLYFAENSSKAHDYTKNAKIHEHRIMLVVDVVVGDIMTYTKNRSKMIKPPDGFHSVYGKAAGDGDLNYSENIVYCDDAALATYCIHYIVIPKDDW